MTTHHSVSLVSFRVVDVRSRVRRNVDGYVFVSFLFRFCFSLLWCWFVAVLCLSSCLSLAGSRLLSLSVSFSVSPLQPLYTYIYIVEHLTASTNIFITPLSRGRGKEKRIAYRPPFPSPEHWFVFGLHRCDALPCLTTESRGTVLPLPLFVLCAVRKIEINAGKASFISVPAAVVVVIVVVCEPLSHSTSPLCLVFFVRDPRSPL